MKKKMKQVTAWAVAALMLLSVAGCGASTTTAPDGEKSETATEKVEETLEESQDKEQKFYQSGTYTASAQGNNGPVTVEVVFSDTEILSVVVTEHSETDIISTPAISQIPEAIVDRQSLAVDAVSGATHTSEAILAAVTACVEQANGDVNMLLENRMQEEQSTEEKELSADVVIVGAGGVGLSAAVSASKEGASVIMIEKMPFVGGSTSLSGGLVNAAGTEIQIAQGITEDTIEQHVSDTWNRGDQLGNLELVTLLCTEVHSTMDWLEDMGLEWNPEVKLKPDCTYARSHTPIAPEGYTGKLGGVYTTLLDDVIEKTEGVEVYLDTEATGIIMENGEAVGITASASDGTSYTIYGKSIILAAGGFAANGEMVHEYDETIPADCSNSVHPGATGEVLKMAEELGANLVGMEYIKSLLYSDGATTSFSNAILINEDGQRFIDELSKAEVLNAALFGQSSQVYMIYDSLVVGEVTEEVQEMIDAGDMYTADTLEELAGIIGVNAENLVATVDAYNQAVRGESEDVVGRTTFDALIETGPYYAAVPYVQVSYTNGGVEINTSMQVISAEGEIMPGLYAAGEITGGVHGSYRVGGNAVAEALTFGRLCGQYAAQYALNE